MLTVPYAYQKEGVQKLDDFGGRALLADSMGLGKTLQILMYLEKHPDMRPAIIVCPASLKWNWENEALKHCGIRSHILEGRKPKKGMHYNHPIIIINYDILPYWINFLLKMKPQILVLDEIHYIKSRSSKRGRACKKLAKKIPHVIGLSGTPLTNRPSELWHPLHVINPDIFPSFIPFAFKYCKPKKTIWGWEYKGASNLPELHRVLKSTCMIRRLKSEVLKDLPEKIRTITPLKLPDMQEYYSAVSSFKEWYQGKKNLSQQEIEMKIKSRLIYFKRLVGELKIPLMKNWIDDFLQSSDEKLVFFGVHRHFLSELHEHYKNSVIVNGSVTGRKRQIAVDQFQHDKRTRIFFGNIAAAGVGITLTAAKTLAFGEVDFIPANHAQAEDRIHRIGQTRGTSIVYLIAKGTIEESICRMIQEKQKVIDKVLEGTETGDLAIFDRLIKEMKGGILAT